MSESRLRDGQMAKPRTMAEKVWDDHVVVLRGGLTGARLDLHRPAFGARGHQPAGVRRSAPGRTPGAPARSDDRHRGPQRAHHRHRQADRRSGVAHPGRDTAAQLRRIRRPALSDGRHRTGHRARHRAAVGSHPTGNDGRLWRQSHLYPRRIRRAGDGHRHLGGRACAGHPDAAVAAVQDDGGQRRRRSCPPA